MQSVSQNLNTRPNPEALSSLLNPLASNDVYMRRTAQLISRRCILNIYSTNILTEYFNLLKSQRARYKESVRSAQ